MIVRHTLVQLLTPDEMRGRVSAVNNLFIGTSNELGGFESGSCQPIPGAGVLGGFGRYCDDCHGCGVAGFWPEIRKFGRLVQAEPVKEPVREGKVEVQS